MTAAAAAAAALMFGGWTAGSTLVDRRVSSCSSELPVFGGLAGGLSMTIGVAKTSWQIVCAFDRCIVTSIK